jgi:glutathione-specific gamma-glutamylcyclotransferase
VAERAPGDVWVFGYASLMWSTGFAHQAVEPARVFGYHRALCVYSHVYRGSPEKPGLVAGLLPGGSCRGLAFRVASADWTGVRDYLHAREMIYGVYVPRWVKARVGATQADVYTFIANPAHAQYAGRLEEPEIARIVAGGIGQSGSGVDYLANTVSRLVELGIRDRALERVLARLSPSA